jgi:hypothetical protein
VAKETAPATGLKTYKPKAVDHRLKALVYGPPGGGKCLKIGTEVLMHDGTIKKVEDVVSGDALMGPDSKPRNVLSTTRGVDPLYRITPVKGEPFCCNGAHILVLKMSADAHPVVELTVDDYLTLAKWRKEKLKLIRTGVEFDRQKTPVDPYIVGLWMGCGTRGLASITKSKADVELIEAMNEWAEKCGLTLISLATRNTFRWTFAGKKWHRNPMLDEVRKWTEGGEKNIPQVYLVNDRQTRLELLAGLIDTDGSLSHNGYDIITVSTRLAAQIVFLARSLGYAATRSKCKKGIKSLGFIGDYTRIYISGETDEIPCRLLRKKAEKRRQIKDALVTGFTVESIGEGEYAGFEIDGDGRFLLADFTVTHNTTLMGTANDCPDMSPALMVNLEGGMLSLVDMANPPDVFDVEGDIAKFEEVYWELFQGEHGYKTVCFDSLSELQRLHREQLVGGRAQAGRRIDMFDVQQKDWGDNMNYILFWMRRFRDLPMHVLASCHSEIKQKPGEGERITPLLNRALVEPMCGIFDVVGYLFTALKDPEDPESEIVRRLLVEPRTVNGIEFYAKDRSPSGRIGGRVTNPTMSLIWSRLQKSRKTENGHTPNQTTTKKKPQPAAQAATGEA